MDTNVLGRWACFALSGWLLSTASAQTKTNIRLDGSLGGRANQVPKLIGSEYQIDASIGRLSRNKANLLHSFSTFDVGPDAAVRFSAPPGVKNILARVTGGPSLIDGAIRSNSPADLFLIDPAGITFAKNAKLELTGSFTATTADLVRLPDGTELQSRPIENPVLKVAPQASFGFSGKAAPILLDGCHLSVASEQNLALVGGDVQLRNASITTDESSTLRASAPHAPLGTSTSGDILIMGKDMLITGSSGSISKRATDNNPGKNVTIDLTGNLTITDQGKIDVGTSKDNDAGNVTIKLGGDLLIDNHGRIKTNNNKVDASGFAGSVEIQATNVKLSGGGSIDTSSRGGDSGSISIFTNRLTMMGNGTAINGNIKDGFGNGGLVALHVNDLAMSDHASITAEGLTPGLAGSFTLEGKTGPRATSVSMKTGAVISFRAGSDATGVAGDVSLHADTISLSGNSTVIKVSTLAQFSGNDVDAGNIVIDGDNLSITDHAKLSAVTQGVGNGGSIRIHVKKLTINNGTITSESTSSGNAGVVDIQVNSGMYLTNSMIETNAPNANGGQIHVTDNGVLTLDDSIIQTNAGDFAKKVDLTAGNITIGRGLVVLDNSQILANSSGTAGDITIDTKGLIRTEGSKINAIGSSEALNGTIAVNGPETDLAGQLVTLPDQLQNALAQLHECCQLKLTRSLSSFVQKGVGGVPLDLGGWTPVSDLQSPKKNK